MSAADPRTASLSDGHSRSTGARRAVVVVVNGTRHEVAGAAIVGRARNADVPIDDPAISQFHVELVTTEHGVLVRDLGSRNGTFANDIAVERATVPSGTSLRIGSTRVEVLAGSPCVVELSKATSFGGLVGASPAMREIYHRLERLARATMPVLVEGEPGTGKDLAVRALHDAGKRDGALVVVRCGAIPPEMASVLFFGGATPSVFDAAAGGTVLFDEIAELPAAHQVKLAAALGAIDESRARVVATTSRALRPLVNRGAFREEVYVRLAPVHVRMPPLRERRDDVKPLVQHFLETLPWTTPAARAIAPDALDRIAEHDFPGNVRELRAMVQRAATMAEGHTITIDDVAFERTLERSDAPETPLESFKEAKRTVIDEFERAYLARLLARAGTNVSRAASLAGIERQSLRDLLKRHGLRGDD